MDLSVPQKGTQLGRKESNGGHDEVGREITLVFRWRRLDGLGQSHAIRRNTVRVTVMLKLSWQ